MKFHGQDDELQWLREDVNDGSLTQTYKNTPWLSLNVSIAGEDIAETGYNKDQTSLGVMSEQQQQQNNGWDKRCMTNMVKEEVDINKYNREATDDRPGDTKFDNKDQTSGMQFNLR